MALVAVQVFFGLFPIFGKFAFEDFAPAAVGAWRMAVGALALGAAAALLQGRAALVERRDLPRLFWSAMLGIVINMVLFLEGLERSTTVNAGLIMPVIPVFTFVIAAAVRQERFIPVRALGILLAFAGTATLFLDSGPDFTRDMLVGNTLMVINALSYSLFLVVARPLLARYPPLVVIAWVFLLSVPSIPLFALDAALVPADVSTRGWLSLAYILVFATVGAYLLNTFALARVSASTTATYIFLQPLVTIGAGLLLVESERLRPMALLSGAITFSGVWLVVRRKAAPPLQPARAAGASDASETGR